MASFEAGDVQFVKLLGVPPADHAPRAVLRAENLPAIVTYYSSDPEVFAQFQRVYDNEVSQR